MTFNNVNNDDGYFNDLSRQPQLESQDSTSPHDQKCTDAPGDVDGTAKAKRIACKICRKRKLKCDGNRPKCATCARLGHNCAYDEVRRKSGPKRGYVKDLEARLAQVEGKLKNQNKKSKDGNEPEQNGVSETAFATGESAGLQAPMQQSMPNASYDSMPVNDPISLTIPNMVIQDPAFMPQLDLNLDQSFSWEMIGLGLEEPMPTQEAVNELTQTFFDSIHPSLPMIHRYRYHTSMDLAPDRRPPICLRYSMWCHAASITEKYMHHQDIFYRRARKYIELDEMKSQGEAFVSLAHAQTWTLICAYEFKMMFFPRAWMSVGRAARLALMMGLNRVDGAGLDVKQVLPPPKDWTEIEERRRTFWMAYCVDRYASIGTGWPMAIDERDIRTCLPVSEEAYESSTAQNGPLLEDAMKPQQAAQLSSLAGVVLVTHFFGLNLTHLHRPGANQQEHDMNGPFWKRHRAMDNDLLRTALQLPSHLRLPSGIRNPNVVFLNFALHTSTICLHQAAIFKAEKNQLPSSIIEQSRNRCILAAAEIASVMRLTSHLDVAGMNPFMAFCLYVAARVFVQYLKKVPDDQEVRQSLEFLLAAMRVIQGKNPLTESFLVQLKMDIEGSGLNDLLHNHEYSAQYFEGTLGSTRLPPDYGVQCSPVFHLSETSEESQSPAEHQSPDDSRLPSYGVRKDSPRVRAEDRRPKIYPYRGAPDIFATGQTKDTQKKPGAHPRRSSKPFFPEDWNQGNFAGTMEYPDMDKINAIKATNRQMDTEMIDQSANSRGLTPQSSNGYNHSSSNTSYSPPQTHDEELNSSMNGSGRGIGGGGFMPGLPTPQSHNNNSAAQEQQQRADDPFKIPAGWDLGMGMTPGQGMDVGGIMGMTPEGGWEKLMDSMGWETGRTG